MLSYAKPVQAAAFIIYESFHPGAVCKLAVFAEDERFTHTAERLSFRYCMKCHTAEDEFDHRMLSDWMHGHISVGPNCLHPPSDGAATRSQSTGGAVAEYLLDRRKWADLLREELSIIEAEIARQEAKAAYQAQAAERKALEAAAQEQLAAEYSG